MAGALEQAIKNQPGESHGLLVDRRGRRGSGTNGAVSAARVRPLIRFRLSREGFHFVLILLFILVGAVMRDISLLVLLAGVMFALLLLQWRLGRETLTRLELKRELPRVAACDLNVDVCLTIVNRRWWLGAWLLSIEEPIVRLAPTKTQGLQRGVAVIDNVAPGHHRSGVYHIRFAQRGLYRIGPAQVSTGYPLNLGTSSCQYSETAEIVVHPRLGTLSNRCQELFSIEQQGLSRAISRAGMNEGEFFGLRAWHTGDSQRWIHWRTTARVGELCVRQFEQPQRLQAVLLLDLMARPGVPLSEPEMAAVEQAISFVASLAVEWVSRGHNKLSVAIAGREVQVHPNVQSPVLVNELLEALACAACSTEEHLSQAIGELQASLVRHPHLIVVSTRANRIPSLLQQTPDSMIKRLLERIGIHWLNVADKELEPYFRWSESRSFASDNS